MTHQNVGEEHIPQDPVSEKGLLSCLVQNPSLLSEIPGNLFWYAANRMIHEAVERLAGNPKVKELDFPVLKTELASRGILEDAGGAEYLNEVWGFVTTPSSWQWYKSNLETVRLHREAVMGAQEILRAETPEEALASVEKMSKSAGLVPGSIRHISEVFGSMESWIEKKAQSKMRPVVRFAIPNLDDMLWTEPGNVVVICAETSGGKTSLAAQAVGASEHSSFAIFSIEMEAEAIAARIAANSRSITMKNLFSGRLLPTEYQQMRQMIDEYSERKLWIDDRQATVSQIGNICRSLQRAHGLDAIVVDYLQLITPSARKQDSREQQVAEISRSLKNLAMELRIVIVTMSQLNDDGKVRESRAIAQDADVVLRITSEEIVIQKHRNGPKGTVPVRFVGEYTRFEQAE